MQHTHEIPPRSNEKRPATLDDIAEKLYQAPRRDLSFYIVLICAVIPFWSVVPLSWIFVIYSLRSGAIWSYAWRGWALFTVALTEVFFSVHQFHLARWIDKRAPPRSPYKYSELLTAFRRVLQAGLADLPEYGYDEEDVGRPGSPAEDITTLEFNDPRAMDFRNYLRTWFGKVPWSAIRKQEIYAWLCWAIFNTPFTTLDAQPPARRNVLCEVLDLIEKRAGAAIPEGSNAAIKPLLLTLDSVWISWRPFFWYVGVALSNAYMRRLLKKKWGATIGTYNGVEYILRVPQSWSAEKGQRPIVFLHGLGLGLTQYKIFLTHLMQIVSDRPILVPLQPHVSQELFHPRFFKPMSRDECAGTLAGLLEELGWAKRRDDNDEEEIPISGCNSSLGVTVFSHSNGSFLHSWMLKAYPEMITRSCFVDPVIFCSWEGDLCYNFIYRRPSNGIELVMKYFVGTELGVAHFLQRHFDWIANALWYEEIPQARDPRKTMFFFGGKDAIVDASRVKRYLTSHGVREGLWFNPEGQHGEALLSGGEAHNEMLQWLRDPEYICSPYNHKPAP